MNNYLISLPNRPFKLPVSISIEDGRLRFHYSFSREMNVEVKAMQGAKYHGFDDPTRKYWTVDNCPRNWISIRYLAGENVFANYDKPITPVGKELAPSQAYPFQLEGAGQILTTHRTILAWETGCTKTLTTIIAANNSGTKNGEFWWIGTKGSLREMPGQFKQWESRLRPEWFTYDELKRVMESWTPGRKAPRFVVADEFSRCKGFTTQRTQAVRALSEAVDKDWGDDGFFVGLTGTPSPKDPTDWYSLAEIIKPGFLKEGNPSKFKSRLALLQTKQGEYGMYPELVTWWDDENKCAVCGKTKEHDNHDPMVNMVSFHEWKPSINEIKKLYGRLKGLVSVKFKKDVLSFLPDKRFHTETLTPSPSILRAAKTILKTSKNVITGLTRLRELSDGFQYIEKLEGKGECQVCKGSGKIKEFYNELGPIYDIPSDNFDGYPFNMVTCHNCDGQGQADRYVRDVQEVSCPKEQYFIDLLDKHEDSGRFVCYAGFAGSIDRCCNIARQNGWAVIRVDARGWEATDYNRNVIQVGELFNTDDGDPYLQLFQKGHSLYPRVCFIAHPKSGGMGVTLTASCGLFWYSLSFDGEDYMQGNDRIHRPSMDLNLGATIYRCIHLPSDQLVLDNIEKKVRLQNLTLGKFAETLEETKERIT